MTRVALGAIVAISVALVAGPACAQGFGKTAKSPEKAGAAKKDPAADAFALPANVRLRADQQEPYRKLKQQMEPKLRDALARVESATGIDKDTAARGAMAIRREIRTKLTEILQKPDPEAIKRAQEAARRAQEAWKKQQQQQKKQQQQKRR